jgi:hypothetical protein
MIKYIITKEIEVEESAFESEQIGVFDTEKEAVRYCLSPMRDGFRLWIGDDPGRYVDRKFTEKDLGLAFALADWYKQYGQFVEQDWKLCFPERNREIYLKHITRQGYSAEEALEILSYLPQTVTDEISVNTSKMIELWKAKAPIVEPYRMPLWKKMIRQETKDLWAKGL